MELKTRKDFELAIVHNVENKPVLENILTQAMEKGIFSDKEMEIIVKETKIYKKTRPEAELLKTLPGSRGLVMLSLIDQFPESQFDDELYFRPDFKLLTKQTKIKFKVLVDILNDLMAMELIDKRIKNGLRVRIDFYKLQELVATR